MMNTNKNAGRDRAMRQVQKESFAVDEARLYLDMHPEDMGAKKFFDKHNSMRKAAIYEYERVYGPILSDNINAQKDGWTWINQPFPWD